MLDIRRWQSYVEPGDESDTGSPSKRISRNMDQSFSERSNGVVEEELLPLPEDTLARNLGLDLIVVVAKVTLKYSFFLLNSDMNFILSYLSSQHIKD